MIEERGLIEIGMQIGYLTDVVRILVRGVVGKKGGSGLVGALREMGNLVAFGNLVHLDQDIPFERQWEGETETGTGATSGYSHPRLFLRDPNDIFLSSPSSTWSQDPTSLLHHTQHTQKSNLLHWFTSLTSSLSTSITSLLQLTLTINTRLYSNTLLTF